MVVRSTEQFAKELKKCPREIQIDVIQVLEKIELVEDLLLISNTKKLRGFKNYYRYKTGPWRIGLELLKNTVKVCIARSIGPRGDFYKYFPPV